ncbi:Hypothetical predicted protein [Cloeon dipterum]|uniref:Sphingomyelin phosphodiesterase n=1 Tax=Cloeon dipterum TaxID=197152 RepID=A0A8S1BXA5_9INSE|nr:Hypothetical predicted protein [Cloeon dipterum]
MKLIGLLLAVASLRGGSATSIDWASLGPRIEAMATTGEVDEHVTDFFRLKHTFKPNGKPIELQIFDGMSEKQKIELTCAFCDLGAAQFLSWFNAGDSPAVIVDKGVNLCLDLNVQTERVCRGVLEMFVDMFYYILTERNSTEPVTAAEACGFLVFPTCWVDNPRYQWTLDLDFLGPKPTPETPQLPPAGSPVLKVLQLTDIHVDPNYSVGGNGDCDEPTCCRVDQGAPVNSTPAGYWGDYRDCDLPVHSFINLLEQTSTHSDLAYVIFTGDIIDHGVWATTTQYNIDLINFFYDQLKSSYNVPVLPIFGNHEPHPLNVFTSEEMNVPPEISSDWLYELAVAQWEAWLPGQSANILKGGYYAYEVNPGLKVIGLNTMFCYPYNFWLMHTTFDPAGELIWLANELLASEQANQKVHLLSHIPGNSDCYYVWGKEFRRIVDRFENTIVGQFHGHTHNDHFHLFFDPTDSSRASGIGFVGGSGTSYSNVNPNYRIYHIDGAYDGSSYRVLDHETWYYNLTEANLGGETVPPNWQKLYTFTESFGVASVFPQDMYDLTLRMINDTQLFQLYYSYYVKIGDPSLEEGCDEACVRKLLCKILTSVETDYTMCDQLLPPLP